MKATTHTELYRPFRGSLKRFPRRPLVLSRAGIRTAFRNKKPLLLFFVPLMQTIVTAFVVQLAFSVQSGDIGTVESARMRMAGLVLADAFTKVEQQIVNLLDTTKFFSLLVIAWYGAGLVADDRRLKAHLLYFARPVTRWTYVFGKLGTACFWGAMAIVLPAVIVLVVAVFSSPDWSFLLDRSDKIVGVLAYTSAWVLLHATGILAISSLVKRKNHALVAAVGLFVLLNGIAEFLAEVLREDRWHLLSIFRNFDALAVEWLDVERMNVGWPIASTYAVLGGIFAISFLVLARQVGQMEREA